MILFRNVKQIHTKGPAGSTYMEAIKEGNNNESVDSISGLHRIDVLYEYGLTPLQARIFVDLLACGPSHARELSSRLNLNRVDVYRVLSTLKKRGLVEITLQNPSMYSAIHPKDALNMLMSEEEERLLQLRIKSREVLTWLGIIMTQQLDVKGSVSSSPKNPFFKIVFGRALFECWRKMLRVADREVLSVWSDNGLKLIADRGFFEPFVDCVERGISVRMIASIDERNIDAARRFGKIVNLKHSDFVTSSFRYVIVDNKQAIISATSSPAVSSRILSAVWTNNKAFVDGIKNDFEIYWTNGIDVKSRLANLSVHTS